MFNISLTGDPGNGRIFDTLEDKNGLKVVIGIDNTNYVLLIMKH